MLPYRQRPNWSSRCQRAALDGAQLSYHIPDRLLTKTSILYIRRTDPYTTFKQTESFRHSDYISRKVHKTEDLDWLSPYLLMIMLTSFYLLIKALPCLDCQVIKCSADSVATWRYSYVPLITLLPDLKFGLKQVAFCVKQRQDYKRNMKHNLHSQNKGDWNEDQLLFK